MNCSRDSGPYTGVLDRSAGPGGVGSVTGTGSEGRRDRGPAPSDRGAETSGEPSSVHPQRPASSGHPAAGSATQAVGGLPRHAGDAAALAPRACCPKVDLPAHRQPSHPARRNRRTRRAPGEGEPTLGLAADRRRTAQGPGPGVRVVGTLDLAAQRSGTGTRAQREKSFVGGVPEGAGAGTLAIDRVSIAVLARLAINGFASLWCAWAAITSALLALHLRWADPHPAADDVLVWPGRFFRPGQTRVRLPRVGPRPMAGFGSGTAGPG
jgi:hypothetical protein